MNTQQAYDIVREIVASLKERGENTKLLPEEMKPEAALYDLGVDLIVFSELAEELSQRFNGRDFHLNAYMVPEEYYYLTVGELVERITSTFKAVKRDPLVVYVDDEEENLFVFKRRYGKKLNLQTFTNPNSALSFIQNNSDVKLVITDEVMPGMSGNELCDNVHKTKPLMKFILITGNPNGDGDLMYRTLRKNRFFEFINKPVDFENKGEEYLNVINGILEFDW